MFVRAWSDQNGSGLVLCAAIALVALALQVIEERILGHAILEGIVLAILLGMAWRNLRGVTGGQSVGIAFTAKQVLEFAIVLLGFAVNLPTVLSAGPVLLFGIVLIVAVGITASLFIGRLAGLNPKLATLIAVGNSICGNSAIAAVAPVIAASAEDVASAIALTAVLGVVVVLALPVLIPLLHLSFYQYGVLAGLTVYAVPQVLAATFPVSVLSGNVGTLVKLVRVLLLGPVVVYFSLRQVHRSRHGFRLGDYIPWFITGFIICATLRSVGVIPATVADPLKLVSNWLTVAAMAALGLGVDISAVTKAGARVTLVILASLAVLLTLSLALIRFIR